MTPADAYAALYDAAPALRAWLPAHRPAFDAAVRRAATVRAETPTRRTPRAPRPVKLAAPTLRTLSVERAQDLRTGTILRAGDTRAVKIADYGRQGWLVEPGDTRASDETIAGMGAWAVEAYAPPWKRYAEIVYLDLDGTGRKVYRADASPYEVRHYEQAVKGYEQARAAGKDARAPSRPSIYRVQHAGVEYTLTPESWMGVTDALGWKPLNDPRPTRRAEAQAKADRRALSPGAARALDAMVLAVLSDPRDRGVYPLTTTDLWRDFTENRQNVFARLRDNHEIRLNQWVEAFTPEGDDDALLNDAAFSARVGTRLLAGALRRLVAGGWAGTRLRDRDNAEGFVQAARTLPSATVKHLTDYMSEAARTDRDADTTEARLRREHGGFSSYEYLRAPEYLRFQATRDAVRVARAAVAHPFATEADIDRLNAAVAALRALSG